MDKNNYWINVQAKIMDVLPSNIWHFLYSLRATPGYLHWLMSLTGREHLKKNVNVHRNKYKNFRCVIIGNGPSLKNMDLNVLKNEFTFGLNRIYLLFAEWGFETTFLVSVNRFVLEQFSADIQKLRMLKFLNWKYRSSYQVDENTVFLSPKPLCLADGKICNGIYPISGTVTNAALEIAYFMGFSEVILIGVDHSFVEKGVGNTAVITQSSDQNHFSPDYFGKGVIWQLPDYVVMEKGYAKMKDLFEQNGRRVVDATVGGKLQIFPKVSFNEYLSTSKYRNKLDFYS